MQLFQIALNQWNYEVVDIQGGEDENANLRWQEHAKPMDYSCLRF